MDRERRKNGRFVLLGSGLPELVRQVSESLAGRVGIIDLDPLTVAATRSGADARNWWEVWLCGGFPDALRGRFREWHEAYLHRA